MTTIRRDGYGNAVRTCDLGCGREGTIPLFEGQRHACMPCAIRASERVVVRREIKQEQAARAEAIPAANRLAGGLMRGAAMAADVILPVAGRQRCLWCNHEHPCVR